MTFQAESNLWLLVGVAALAAVYLVAQLRRQRYTVRFTNLELLASVAPRHPGWRRHLTTLAFLLMLATITVTYARPAHSTTVPDDSSVVVVALDISRSMQAKDVAPTRIEVARRQATRFVAGLPERVKVGLVVFAGSANMVVAPTTNRGAVLRAIGTTATNDGTAVGEALFTSLDALHALAARRATRAGRSAAPQALGSLRPAIVVLSDGETTAGRPVADAGRAAHDAQVPVSTIAVGTQKGTVEVNGLPFSVPVRRTELRDLAKSTGGRHYDVANDHELENAYSELSATITRRPAQQQIAGWFVLGAVLAGVLAAVGSLAWFARAP